MTDETPAANQLIATLWPKLDGIEATRMTELVSEIQTVVQAARREAPQNDFDAEPTDFLAMLHRLADLQGGTGE